jgi:hypothetical protein
MGPARIQVSPCQIDMLALVCCAFQLARTWRARPKNAQSHLTLLTKDTLPPGMIISTRSVLLFFFSKEWSTSEHCIAELSTIFKYRREKMMHEQKIFFVLLDKQDHEGGTLVRLYIGCDLSTRARASAHPNM